MIFCTVGTEKFPFDRLVRSVDLFGRTAKEEIFIQIGTAVYEPEYSKWERFVSFSKMVQLIREARIVVCHAGVGIVLLCGSLNKIPIVVPRLKSLGEHIDNHQPELCKKLASEGKIIAVYDEKELGLYIDNYAVKLQELPATSGRSTASLASYLTRLVETRKVI